MHHLPQGLMMYRSADVAAPKSGPFSFPNPSPSQPAQRLWHRIRALRQCTLTTRTPYGEPHSRTLRLQNRSLAEGEPLWFFIERGSDLVLDVRTDPHVSLDFSDAHGNHVTVQGRALVLGSQEHAALAARHGCSLPAWHGNDERQRLSLLRVEIEQVRYQNAPRPSRPPQPRQLALA